VSDPSAPEVAPPTPPEAALNFTLSTYFPPSEANGGWRRTTSATKIRSLGMEPSAIAALGNYAMALPWEGYFTGVSGYKASNKAALVIKDGWIVGEYYNQASARTAVYYLASNGKTFAMMLMGRMQLDYPALAVSLDSRLYQEVWLREGFPLTDPRKADITLDHVFRHESGIIPQVQAKIADGAVVGGTGWDFAPFTVGKDPDYPVSARLYFDPGQPSSYTKGSPYSSVAFNHLSLLFRSVTGLEPGTYLRQGLLDPIGAGRMAYKVPSGMGDYLYATGGNGLASARDYARLAYLLLHEGNWAGKRLFTPEWIRQFTQHPGYPNLSSNGNCLWGTQYPKDLYRLIGSGINLAFVVPSLDLLATLNGRTPNALRDEVSRTFLQKLFAGVTEEYITCDGRVINGAPSTVQSVAELRLINADTDQALMQLVGGSTITLADLPTRNLNVQALTSPATVGSVRFGLDGVANYRTETSPPYSLAGDDAGNYRPWTPGVGSHTIKATPYSAASGSGTAGTPLSVSFTIR
jgi:CubicO group peptidase (beta-lactamase class C family)